MVFIAKCFLPVVHNPQSNSLAENVVKQAKNLLCKCKKEGSVPFLASLICLMFREIKHCFATPVAKQLLNPKAASSRIVASRLKWKRQQQKAYYNQHAKYLPLHHPKLIVRLQTEKSHEKVGIVKKPAAQPRSYIVQTEEKVYHRNQGHLLAILKPIPSPSATHTPPHLPAVPQHPPTESNPHQPPTMSNEDVLPEAMGPIKTPAMKPAEPKVCQVPNKNVYRYPSSTKAFPGRSYARGRLFKCSSIL